MSRFGLSLSLSLGPEAPVVSTDPFAGVSRDATSNIYLPANASQWTTFRAAAGLSIANPNSLWLCQEASGNLADSIGSLTLAAVSTPTYQNAVAGWTRKGVGANSAADSFQAANGVGPSVATTSQTWLALFFMSSPPAGARDVVGSGNVTGQIGATGAGAIKVIGTTNNGATNVTGAVSPWVVKYNRTGSEAKLFTLADKITGTYNAGTTDGVKGIGALVGAGSAALGFWLYACMWSGADAEISDANLKALLQAMGFTIPWS